MTALRWFGALLAFYGPYLSVALYFLILVPRRCWRRSRCGPAWLSVRLLAWLGAVGAAAAAFVTWANLQALSHRPDRRPRPSACGRARSRRRCLPPCWSPIALLRYSFGRRGSRDRRGVLDRRR